MHRRDARRPIAPATCRAVADGFDVRVRRRRHRGASTLRATSSAATRWGGRGRRTMTQGPIGYRDTSSDELLRRALEESGDHDPTRIEKDTGKPLHFDATRRRRGPARGAPPDERVGHGYRPRRAGRKGRWCVRLRSGVRLPRRASRTSNPGRAAGGSRIRSPPEGPVGAPSHTLSPTAPDCIRAERDGPLPAKTLSGAARARSSHFASSSFLSAASICSTSEPGTPRIAAVDPAPQPRVARPS